MLPTKPNDISTFNIGSSHMAALTLLPSWFSRLHMLLVSLSSPMRMLLFVHLGYLNESVELKFARLLGS